MELERIMPGAQPALNCKCLLALDTCISPRGSCPGADAPITPPARSDTRAITSFGPLQEPSFFTSSKVLGQVGWNGLHDFELPCGNAYGLKPDGM